MHQLKIMRLPRQGRLAPLPRYQTEGAAAMDLCAFLEEPLTLAPGQRALVPTGLAIELPPLCAGLVLARSGLASRAGVALSNGVGLIDPDYRGELLVALENRGQEPFTVRDGDRVAQLLLTPFVRPQLCEDTLSETARGTGGIGSTGVR